MKKKIGYKDLANHLKWFVWLGWAVMIWLTLINVVFLYVVIFG